MAKTISAVYHNAFRGIRDLFISLLGLKFQSTPKDANPDDFPDIVPLSLLVGRPEALAAVLDKSEGEEAARAVLSVLGILKNESNIYIFFSS